MVRKERVGLVVRVCIVLVEQAADAGTQSPGIVVVHALVAVKDNFVQCTVNCLKSLDEVIVLCVKRGVCLGQRLEVTQGVPSSLLELALKNRTVRQQHLFLKTDQLLNQLGSAFRAACNLVQIVLHEHIPLANHQLLKRNLLDFHLRLRPASYTYDSKTIAHELELLCK